MHRNVGKFVIRDMSEGSKIVLILILFLICHQSEVCENVCVEEQLFKTTFEQVFY